MNACTGTCMLLYTTCSTSTSTIPCMYCTSNQYIPSTCTILADSRRRRLFHIPLLSVQVDYLCCTQYSYRYILRYYSYYTSIDRYFILPVPPSYSTSRPEKVDGYFLISLVANTVQVVRALKGTTAYSQNIAVSG